MIFDNVKRSRPHQSCKENQQCSVCKSTSSVIRLRWVRWDCDGKQGVWYFHALMVPVVSIILPRNAVMNFLKYLDREASSVASQLILIKVFILGPWSPGKMLQWVQMIEPQIPFLPESQKTLTSGTCINSATWITVKQKDPEMSFLSICRLQTTKCPGKEEQALWGKRPQEGL